MWNFIHSRSLDSNLPKKENRNEDHRVCHGYRRYFYRADDCYSVRASACPITLVSPSTYAENRASKPKILGTHTLTVPERMLLFCLASDTDPVKAGVPHSIAQVLIIKNLIGKDRTGRHVLTDLGRGVLQILIINAPDSSSGVERLMWQVISTAPFDRDLELAVIDGDGPHALVFPCRRVLGGWTKAETKERIDVRATHWRQWDQSI